MKLSKEAIKKHQKAEEILQKESLTMSEKLYVLENWNEAANHVNSKFGAFFTPIDLAKDFSLEIYSGSNVIDLCAGIGRLAFFAYHDQNCEVTCVEYNRDYYNVGKKILPEANWINDSIFNLDNKVSFDQAISNPPFGKLKTGLFDFKGNYKGSEFEFMAIEKASFLAEKAVFLIPQLSTPYKYSGEIGFNEVEPSQKLKKFINETGIEFQFNIGIDTSIHINDWNGVSPTTEIVTFEFEELQEKRELKNKSMVVQQSLF